MEEVNQNRDEELKIINRRCEYFVSKKFICSAVPYFQKLFSSDMLAPKENIVILDFDERAFDALLNWIHTDLFIIEIDYVISFYEAADYLKIDEPLYESCIDYFHNNFTIEHIPVVLRQVTEKSQLINSGAIGSFICRHFLKIANTDTFLEYPIETVEAILKLDLMVYSEYQIFEAIMRWVNKNTDFRRQFLSRLLNYVRWSFIDPEDLTKIKNNQLIKTLINFDAITCSNSECKLNRSDQSFFVSLHTLDDSKLRINIYDRSLLCLPIGDFSQDVSMEHDLVHEEHITDIIFDSGTSGVRVDWLKKTFAWFPIEADTESYYLRMHKLIVNFQDDRSEYSCYLDDRASALPDTTPDNVYLLLEYNDGFICIGATRNERKYFGIFPVTDSSWFKGYTSDQLFHITILNKVVYVLTEELTFFQFNMETRAYSNIELVKGVKDYSLSDLILTSHQTRDDKVILIDKLTGKIYVYCINKKKWSTEYQIFNSKPDSSDFYTDVDELITFTSTFLSMKNIKPLFKRNFL